MNVAIREQDRDLVVFMLCPSNMCFQQDRWPETRSPSRQRAISIWRRSGDYTLHHECNALVMFLLIGRTEGPKCQNFAVPFHAIGGLDLLLRPAIIRPTGRFVCQGSKRRSTTKQEERLWQTAGSESNDGLRRLAWAHLRSFPPG